MAIVEVTPRAAADIDGIVIHLHGRAGRTAADRQQADFRAVIRLLEHHPEIGRRRPDIGSTLRSVFVRPYIIIYRYDRARDTVFVLRVLHGRRSLARDAT